MQVVDVPQAPLPSGLPPWETLPPQVTLLIVLAVVVGTVLLFAPLLKAVARSIEGGGRSGRAELDQLRRRLDEMEQQALTSGEAEASFNRVTELEERLDFVERVLSSGKDGESR
jgi:hypothetical protein